MQKIIKAGIVGGAGYTGGELVRLLLHHPAVKISFIHSSSNANKPVSHVHEDLVGYSDLTFADKLDNDIEVLFLCVGHGDSRRFFETNTIDGKIKVISLSQDFRLANTDVIQDRRFTYGLPEAKREAIRNADNVANPGCFATAIQLGLLPLAKAGLLNDVFTTGITGSTGAGQALSPTSHFSWRQNNIQAYKTLTHQHLNEINETLLFLGGRKAAIHFVPWRGDFARGIFISSQLKCDNSLEEVTKLYKDFYSSHPFTFIKERPLFMKQVVNTNNCVIHIEKEGDIIVVHSAIDNLVKGASGQALQNMNLMFGLEESLGLKLKANYF